MSTVILNVLCEGQTEERFVKEVLKPYLQDKGIIVKHRLLLTGKKKNVRGGMLGYEKVKNDLVTWIKQTVNKKSEQHYFTTMFDLYALPDDFPGWKDAMGKKDKYHQVQTVEEAFFQDIDHHCFIPYIQLHEFEALVFCGLDKLLVDYPKCQKGIKELKKTLSDYNNNPEEINNSPRTAPSKRIIEALKGEYNYNKPKSGATVTKTIGIDGLRLQCRHFDEWIKKLETIK
jgi:hypothetical protein